MPERVGEVSRDGAADLTTLGFLFFLRVEVEVLLSESPADDVFLRMGEESLECFSALANSPRILSCEFPSSSPPLPPPSPPPKSIPPLPAAGTPLPVPATPPGPLLFTAPLEADMICE